MRFRAAWLMVMLGLTASTAEAVPITFEFVLTWDLPQTMPQRFLFGAGGNLDVTVDNMQVSPFSQTYRLQDVTFLTLDTTPYGGRTTETLAQNRRKCPEPLFDCPPDPQLLFTTTMTGMPLLDFSLFADFDPANMHGFGLTDGIRFYKGHITYSSAGSGGGVTMDGTIVGTIIPEPSTLALLGLGAVGLGLSRRRQRGHFPRGRTGSKIGALVRWR